MAEPLANIADVEARGHPVADLDQQVEHLLRLGSALLRRRFVDIDARITADVDFDQLVKDVLVAMVLRAPSIANPGGIRSESTASYSVTYVATTGSGEDEIGITAQEAGLLAPPDADPVPMFGSARLRAMLS